MKGEFGKPFNFRFFRLLREILLQACLPVPFFHLPSTKKKVVKTLSFPRNKERWENLSFFCRGLPVRQSSPTKIERKCLSFFEGVKGGQTEFELSSPHISVVFSFCQIAVSALASDIGRKNGGGKNFRSHYPL